MNEQRAEDIQRLWDISQEMADLTAELREIAERYNDRNAIAYLIEQLENLIGEEPINRYDMSIGSLAHRLEGNREE